ncbi:MAG: hypothetical protein WC798_00740 [Candidatus Paceibacterota bacterium]|jgi:hypothetical protein
MSDEKIRFLKKQFLYFLLAWFVGAAFLYFQYINPGFFPKSARMFKAWGFVNVLIYLAIFLPLSMIIGNSRIYAYLKRPLFGFKETPEGYEDTSLEKHPYAIVVIVLIIVIAFAYVLFGSGGMM